MSNFSRTGALRAAQSHRDRAGEFGLFGDRGSTDPDAGGGTSAQSRGSFVRGRCSRHERFAATRSCRGACLSRFVAKRLQVEAKVAKEQRKGHKERILARKVKPGPGRKATTPAANLTVSPGGDGEVQCEVPGKRGNGWMTLASEAFRDVARDLLPLPPLEEFVVDDRLLSRSVKRRLLKRQKQVRLTNETVRALNSLCGTDRAPTWRLSEAQRVVQQCHFQARQRAF